MQHIPATKFLACASKRHLQVSVGAHLSRHVGSYLSLIPPSHALRTLNVPAITSSDSVANQIAILGGAAAIAGTIGWNTGTAHLEANPDKKSEKVLLKLQK